METKPNEPTKRQRFWGVSSKGEYKGHLRSSADLKGFLDIVFRENALERKTHKAFNCSGGKYIYILFPCEWGIGNPQIAISGFTVFLANIETIEKFHDGLDYYLLRTDNLLHDENVSITVL